MYLAAKKIVAAVTLLVSSSTCFGQAETFRYYYSYKYGPSEKGTADYWKDVELLGSNTYYYKKYSKKSKELISEGVVCVKSEVFAIDLVNDFNNPNYVSKECGVYKEYYDGEKIKLSRDYSSPADGKTTQHYYHNGQLRSVEQTPEPKTVSDRIIRDLILFYYDSLGNAQVENGEGIVHLIQKRMEEHGTISKGYRVGTWTGIFEEGRFKETYGEHNEVLEGQLVLPNGEIHTYNTKEEQERLTKMNYQLARELAKRFVYPEVARQNNIQGRMFISFVVERDGEITNVEIARSAHPLLDKAGVKAVKDLQQIEPVTMRGIPVRMSYTVPINAKLQ